MKERFVKITYDGSSCTMEPDEAISFMGAVKYDDETEDYKHEDVYMTREEFEALPEFEGF